MKHKASVGQYQVWHVGPNNYQVIHADTKEVIEGYGGRPFRQFQEAWTKARDFHDIDKLEGANQ